MRLFVGILVVALALAGCTGCNSRPDLQAGVGVGASGTHSRVSVGQSCGPMHVRVGTGGMGMGLHL
ncbi:hypothetical protein [Pseudodonghicola flavimaris]|uniref:Lipoprotein n=1 Tax=Pseudodonghicola flavimaris TaxID=3050036 RepID=A0ABT7EWA7_9RHOB|nr:hypothetical protein [Pseudodonghicola flavimaris]MDK3016627.1 hypothetical protein [Pseudodonghicola flavimaris]